MCRRVRKKFHKFQVQNYASYLYGVLFSTYNCRAQLDSGDDSSIDELQKLHEIWIKNRKNAAFKPADTEELMRVCRDEGYVDTVFLFCDTCV